MHSKIYTINNVNYQIDCHIWWLGSTFLIFVFFNPLIRKCQNTQALPHIYIYRWFTRRGTHLYAHDFATPLGFLFVWGGIEKNNKKRLNFWFTLWKELLEILIFLSRSYNLVLWYELNKKFWDILLYFPIPLHVKRKPTWRLRAWWLAKLAWYDVTWKPSIVNSNIKLACQYCDTAGWLSVNTFHPRAMHPDLFWLSLGEGMAVNGSHLAKMKKYIPYMSVP